MAPPGDQTNLAPMQVAPRGGHISIQLELLHDLVAKFVTKLSIPSGRLPKIFLFMQIFYSCFVGGLDA